MTLVILAAGLGSRYGGLKQIVPVGKNGEFIIDYSVFDAIKAGFNKVIFVIKKENYEIFSNTIGKRVSPYIKTEYAFQNVGSLPEGYKAPDTRTRPWGTTHALLSAKDLINENFAVINSDDFYGRGAFETVFEHLSDLKGRNACMAGYKLKNTLSENGSVARGICRLSGSKIEKIEEHTKLIRSENEIVCTCSEPIHSFPEDSFVSMNFFGFTKDILPLFEDGFRRFLDDNLYSEKAEYYLPSAASEFTQITLYPTDEHWFGVTYREDHDGTVKKIGKMTEEGIYPEKLWD